MIYQEFDTLIEGRLSSSSTSLLSRDGNANLNALEYSSRFASDVFVFVLVSRRVSDFFSTFSWLASIKAIVSFPVVVSDEVRAKCSTTTFKAFFVEL